MDSELVGQLGKRVRRVERRPTRQLVVEAIGPLTILAGLVWAIAQPYRITLLSPRGADFWSLAVQPPLLVILVGLLFALVVAPGLVEDLEAAEEERRRSL